MDVEFKYSPTIRIGYYRHNRQRLVLWSIISLPFWIFGTQMHLRSEGTAGILFAFVIVVVIGMFEALFRQFSRESIERTKETIRHGANSLRQLGPTGELKAEIQLDSPYAVDYYYPSIGQAIYRVRQGNEILRFGVGIERGEHLVKSVLKCSAWPPPIRVKKDFNNGL